MVRQGPHERGDRRAGDEAAAARLPFLPIRAGLGSAVVDFWEGELQTVTSPYPGESGEAETLIAMPALNLDAALVHLNIGDAHGNAAYTGVDPYFDDLYCLAAEKRFVSVERIVETEELVKSVPLQSLVLNRMMVDGVVEAPLGAHFTLCDPDYPRDEAVQRAYAASAASPERPALWMGSHLDSVPEGGNYDGLAGVVAGLLCLLKA